MKRHYGGGDVARMGEKTHIKQGERRENQRTMKWEEWKEGKREKKLYSSSPRTTAIGGEEPNKEEDDLERVKMT